MLSAQTVLILGAGSSVDFGLPDGNHLKNLVRNALTFRFEHGAFKWGSEEFYFLLRKCLGSHDEVIRVSEAIIDGLPSFKSIDDFLYTHSHDENIKLAGKMAIACVIAEAERNGPLYHLSEPQRDVRRRIQDEIRATWAGSLLQLLATGLSRNDLDQLFSHLTIINFNYDRCLEKILFELMQPAFDESAQRAAQVMKGLTVYRPYGSLGELALSGDTIGTPFGPNLAATPTLADRIRVYTEELGTRPDLAGMGKALNAATNVIFLGFGFHKQNMQLLDQMATRSHHQEAYATVYRVPEPSLTTIRNRINGSVHPSDITLGDPETVNCLEFFRQYEMRLAG